MIHIKNFIDKVSIAEVKQHNNLVIPMIEARGLRDELAKLLVDLHGAAIEQQKESKDLAVQIELKGGSFK